MPLVAYRASIVSSVWKVIIHKDTNCLETIFLFIYHTPIYKNELYNQYQNIIYYEIQIYLIKIYLSILQERLEWCFNLKQKSSTTFFAVGTEILVEKRTSLRPRPKDYK